MNEPTVYRPNKLFRTLLRGQAGVTLIVPLFITWIMWRLLGIGSPSFWQNPLYTPWQQLQMIGIRTPITLLALYIGSAINSLYVHYTLEDMRLELSSDGIALHQLGLSQFARWEDVKSFQQLLWLRELQLAEVESTGVLSFTQFWVRWKKFSLTPFVSDWYYSALKKDLEHHAPHLFDKC